MHSEHTTEARTRYAIVGTGNRCEMYIHAILGEHSDVAELVALFDLNAGRLEYFDEVIEQTYGRRVDGFHPRELGEYIRGNRIDRVIVTSPDSTHAEVICTALEAGADVVVEKPLTINAEDSRRITHTAKATGKNVIVTFNYRYSPRNTALKKALLEGQIGEITSIDFTWMLDTVHGADYFRRWHRQKANSGGLLIHKSSHHFDLVNWWLDDTPAKVYAAGALSFYGPQNAKDRGQQREQSRGTFDGSEDDPFALDLRSDPRLQGLYLDNEHLDGYLRDQDVFSGEIDIEDNLALTVNYGRGAILSYSLNAHSPWEGYRVAVNGTQGRIELDVVERAAVLPAAGGSPVDPSVTADSQDSPARARGEHLVLQRHWEAATEVEIVNGEGSHGGGDILLLSDIFRGAVSDAYERPAGLLDGVAAIAVGIAGNQSLLTGLPVEVADLGLGLESLAESGATLVPAGR
ncbi:Gfo/Idh/MocA family oxidoreductase [Paeniglutamicibacter psychrophenolicus]|uniref:Dehydrogenase n=1 Tax=Paeniglutamicibacter psychrophenolicus TaxID=257454 RepID=A0ABS4W9Z7_9MICC|nr:Gfo/Idh/MocA family oxidoreductase [Paeniglutamicibacter psychrophenolicus]MBP2372963.1 putative dehydrogenase [Paeniglutamicibacter psychrophenolicus]